jgi:glutamine amidotransferase
MCRLFGFRSVIPSQVHRSLLAAENALGVQSNEHPDGWGVAFYVDDAPHVTRSPTTALGDTLFHRLSGVVSSETVLAHVRKATRGNNSVLNCHPFQYGRWVFAHNGDVPDLESRRAALLAEVIFLSRLEAYGPLGRRHSVADAAMALRGALRRVRELCGGPDLFLTCIATDGHTLVAAHGGKELFVSTHKTRCSDRDHCPSLSTECEAPSATGFVNHFILSSEPLQGENVWQALEPGDIVGVDWRMQVHRSHLERPALAVAL